MADRAKDTMTRCAEALERIATVLEVLALSREEVEEPTADTGPVECRHPKEVRRDTTTLGSERQYYCGACGCVILGAVEVE